MSTVEPVTEPEVALIVVVPAATPVARPWLPLVLLIVAMPVATFVAVTVAPGSAALDVSSTVP